MGARWLASSSSRHPDTARARAQPHRRSARRDAFDASSSALVLPAANGDDVLSPDAAAMIVLLAASVTRLLPREKNDCRSRSSRSKALSRHRRRRTSVACLKALAASATAFASSRPRSPSSGLVFCFCSAEVLVGSNDTAGPRAARGGGWRILSSTRSKIPETHRADAVSLTLASAATRRQTDAATHAIARAHQVGSGRSSHRDSDGLDSDRTRSPGGGGRTSSSFTPSFKSSFTSFKSFKSSLNDDDERSKVGDSEEVLCLDSVPGT
mmetsp:Transcript_11622/g.38219  ORF Transcript_11622/g.38219 Transcript_11622/m.38219 type:complete len:268 (-) Transcript_11622:670-1473(-)